MGLWNLVPLFPLSNLFPCFFYHYPDLPQFFCSTCGQALPWSCQWYPQTVMPSSKLTVKTHWQPSPQSCGIPWEPGAIPFIHNMPSHTPCLKHRRYPIDVGWMRAVLVMEVHCSDHPSREPTAGSTAGWEPPVSMVSNYEVLAEVVSPGFSQSMTKDGGYKNPATSLWGRTP